MFPSAGILGAAVNSSRRQPTVLIEKHRTESTLSHPYVIAPQAEVFAGLRKAISSGPSSVGANAEVLPISNYPTPHVGEV